MGNYFGNFVPIENEKNYEPGKGIFPKGDQYIIALHLTRSLEGDVILTNLTNEKTKFPPTAFIAGGVYNFPVTQIEYLNPNDDKAFMGCRFGYRSF